MGSESTDDTRMMIGFTSLSRRELDPKDYAASGPVQAERERVEAEGEG